MSRVIAAATFAELPAQLDAGSTTSASAAPTPEPASCCSSATLDIRIINAATGELLRQLTLDPARNYQPTRRPPGPTTNRPRKRSNPEP